MDLLLLLQNCSAFSSLFLLRFEDLYWTPIELQVAALRFCTQKSWTTKRLANTGLTRVLAPAPAASGRVRSNRRGNHESILGSLDHDILFFRTGHVAPNAGAQEHHHATGGRHRIPRHRHQPARCRGLGHDAELFRPPLHVRFINDQCSCGGKSFKILLQAGLGKARKI